jgi:stress response protein SCP2
VENGKDEVSREVELSRDNSEGEGGRVKSKVKTNLDKEKTNCSERR